ncbi:MAG: type II toxin-antitoxin system RelE/ParE family toxin [Pirellulales bacterium]
MPATRLIFYKEDDGNAPVRDWLFELRARNRKAFAKCVDKISLLQERGHELRRPHADMLRDGIYELRARKGNVNYRILYFFHGQNVAVLTAALTKEAKVSPIEIERAMRRKKAFEHDPSRHSYEEDLTNG